MRIAPLGVFVVCGTLACARGAPAAAPRADDSLDREAILEAAQRESIHGDRRRARTLYQRLAAQSPDDDEARAGLARLDAWEGRWDVSERTYRDLLARHPDDEDVRAGLVDLVLWQRRFAEAEALLAEGLGRRPLSSTLLQRRATLLSSRGDASAARDAADRAHVLALDDQEAQDLQERLFLNEVHLVLQGEFYPAGYPDLFGLVLGYSRKLGRFTLSAETQQLQRFSPVAGDRAYNAAYTFGVTYAIDAGWSVGVTGGFGAPATAIPKAQVGASLAAPIGSRFTASGSYSFMLYPGPLSVHAIRPALGVEFDDDTTAELAYLLTVAVAAPGTRVLHGMSVAGERQLGPIVRLKAGYAHGAEVEQIPGMTGLLSLVTDAGWVSATVRTTSWLFLNPLYRIEVWSRTAAPPIVINAVELGASARW